MSCHDVRINAPLTIVVLAVLGCVRGKPEVTQTKSNYSCCAEPKIQFAQKCQNDWSVNNTLIGYSHYIAENKPCDRECVSPCKRIEDGHMTLDRCVLVRANTVCPDDQDGVEETITQYQAEPCPAPGGSRNGSQKSRLGSVGVMLLSVLLGALTVKLQTTC